MTIISPLPNKPDGRQEVEYSPKRRDTLETLDKDKVQRTNSAPLTAMAIPSLKAYRQGSLTA